MNRVLLALMALLTAAMPLVVDSALKGAALLGLAAVAALLLWRASAATRHLVWLVAVLALLLVPVLSILLPGWRVLPEWAAAPQVKVPPVSSLEKDRNYEPYAAYSEERPLQGEPVASLPAALPASPAPLQLPAPPSVEPASATPPEPPAATEENWRRALPAVWVAGCGLLLARLLGAHWLLRRSSRRCVPVTDGPLATALYAAAEQLGVRRRIRLRLDEQRTIPVVWGVWRPRLILPAEALTWDGAQLQSVLLHELGHIRRRDTLVQWLTQLACALHWFNPLVWLAAWRLHVERERACDDLVLAAGVRPSEYASHLLHVASRLSPARWTSACGLAMARKSSLEGRLLAVLSDKLNRRALTRALTAAAIFLSAAIAVPIAMLRAAEEKPADSKSSGSSETAKEIDWRKVFCAEFAVGCAQLDQLEPFDAAQLHQIAKTPASEFQRLDQTPPGKDWPHNIGSLKALILKAAAARNPDFRYLLENQMLVKDEKYGWGSALKAYDYMVNGNGKALDALLPAEPENAWSSGDALAHIDEWDKSLAWMQKHAGGDGEGYELWHEFWLTRAYLFTDHYKAYFKEHPDCGGRSPEWFSEMSGKPYRGSEIGKETEAKLKWGEPANGLRMALAFPPAFTWSLLGNEPYFQLVVQNVSEKAVHFTTGDDAPNPRSMIWREGERIVQSLSDTDAQKTDWNLAPGECGVLRLFTKEEPTKDGKTISALLEGDLAGGLRYHVICTMEVAKAPAGAWTGKLVTGETRGSADTTPRVTREMLEGVWSGEQDGVQIEIHFRWDSEHQQAHLRVQSPGNNLEIDTSVLLDAARGTARLVFRKGLKFEHEYGSLNAGDGGTMLLDMNPNPHIRDQPLITRRKGLILRKQPGVARHTPEHKDARALYEIWQRHARLSGDIPGALIGELAAAVKVFIGYNPTWETVPKLNEILLRLDATHDWKPADAIALLDVVASVQDSPLQTAAEKTTAATIRQGEALLEKFAGVAWGETQPNGLRAAWVLEPAAAEHRMGTALKARLLVQNTGTIPVMTRVPTWHQGRVSARDAAGTEVEVAGIDWTTIARLVPVRLGPGEFIEINAPGVGLGNDAGRGPWAGPRVGSNVIAKDGTELTLTHGPLALDGSGVGMREDAPHLIGPGWWQAHIKARLARELPLPAGAAERTRLLDRAVRELFATAPAADEIAAFATDQTDGAFDALVQRLAARAGVVEFSASLPTAPVKFRVLAADPAADKTPRVVLGPGEYPLSEGTATHGAVTLKIVGRPVEGRRTNDAQLLYQPAEATGKLLPDPHKLELPDGWGTWAIVCRPGEGFFYLLHKGGARKIDYSDPEKVTDSPATDLPAEFRDEVKRQFDIHEISTESQAEVLGKPATPAPKTADAAERHRRAAELYAKAEEHSKSLTGLPDVEAVRKEHREESLKAYAAVLEAEGEGTFACFAAYRIGSLHYNDQGTADSLDKAISHLGLAARLADVPGLMTEPQASEIRTSALFRLGKCQMKAGRQEEARKTFERVAGMDGINRYKDEARTELNNMALNPEPDSPAGIEYENGLVAVKAGDRTGAKEHYLKAIALDAQHAGAHFNLSILLATEVPADLVEAKHHYLKSLAQGARRDNVMDKLLALRPTDASPKPVQPVTDGTSSAQVLHADGQEPIVILTGLALTASPDSTSRSGAVTLDVGTSDKSKIRYTWPEDAQGFLDLELGGRGVFRFDLSRGRVFFVKLERSADVFQVPAGVKVPAITSPGTLTQAAAAVTAWYAASDDRTHWESSRVVLPDSEYKSGQPLDAAADKIVWDEVNDAGLRLGLGGLEPGASYPVGQVLPLKQYIRNDSTKPITFSPTQIFNEGVSGELVRKADGQKFLHQKGYPWQGFFDRVRLAPGHYIALGSGPLRTIRAEKDGSSPGGMDMMAHGFTVLPGDYTLQLSHGIGQFLGRPANFIFGDPRGAPGLGEWTGILTSAAVPLRLVDQQVKTAKAGDSEAFGNRYMIAFGKGALKLRHYHGFPGKSSRRQGSNDPWEDGSRDWKVPASDGEYVAAWAVGGKGLWVKDASGITHLIVKVVLTENGKWTPDQFSGGLGDMPAGVRAALQLPPAAPQPFDFKKLPNAPGAAKIEGEFFEMALSQGTVLKVPHKGGGFFIESGGSAYGPADGNPVVELGLTDLLRAKLAETPNTAGLEILRHIIADGRGTIRDCGFRLLADLKAPQAPFDYDAVFHAMIHASIEDEHGPKELTPEARLGYTWFHNHFHSARLEWERTRPLLAAGRYLPGETLSADPAIIWTAGPDGLSLGLSGLPADTNLAIGHSVPVAVHLRNDRTAPVKLSVPADHNPVVQISLTDAAGNSHRAHYSFGAPLTSYRHHELAPGTAVKVAAFDLEACATPEEADRAEHKEGKAHNPRLAVLVGSYDLHLEYRNYQENPVPPGPASEWTGKLTAKPVSMKVKAFSVTGTAGGDNPSEAESANDPQRSIKTARFYDKKGNHAAAVIYYSEVMHDPASPYREEAQKSIARLVAADPALKEKVGPVITNKLDPGTEAQLDWGETVFGLRGALIIRSPGEGKPEGIYLVVQNVSDAPRRFMDTTKSDHLRTLYLSDTKGVLAGLSNDEPTMTDVTLQPREVAYLNMMRSDGSPEVAAGLIEGIRKDSLQKWFAVLDMSFSVLGGGWSGKLTTGETRCALREGGPQPKNKEAQALFKHWQGNARLNGDIPGGLIALLHDKVKEFIRNNEPDASGGPYAQKMKPLEPRFAHTGDWKAADVVALLEDIAAAHPIPLDNTLRHLTERTLLPGTPLPASLEKANWGEPLPGGLRVAHVLEPRAGAYHLGTEVKARIVFHNAGTEPVSFITDTFQQPGHTAKRADGTELKLDATEWLTLGSMAAYRLAPGDYCEVHTPGLGIGARDKDREDWAGVRAGSWILCAEGDEVVFTPGPAALSYHDTPGQKADWWLDFITERLNREAPVPTDTKEREYLLYRVVRELYGAAPSTTEGDAFAADKSPDALKNLAALLAKHPYGKRSEGTIRAGSTKFRVLAPDAGADKRPRVATGPGSYLLRDGIYFSVTRRATGGRVVNEASIDNHQKGTSHKVPLPFGHDTWAAATMKGANELWVAEAGTLRRYDLTNPLQPVETRYEGGSLGDAPLSKELRAALDPVLSEPAAEAPKPSAPPPAVDMPASPAAGKPKGADAGPHWKADEVLQLAAAADKTNDDIERLRGMILQAAAEKATGLGSLLKDEALKRSDHRLHLALAAWDYSVNGNKEALQLVLDDLAVENDDRPGAAWTLAWIDEWDLSIKAWEKHSGRIYGSQAEAYGMFWEKRESLFPESYARHFAKELEAAGIDAASLRGVWKGSKDGVNVEIRFGDKKAWEITRDGKTISRAQLMTHSTAAKGDGTVELHTVEETQSDAPFSYAWLKPRRAGNLRLHLYRQEGSTTPTVTEVDLTKQSSEPGTPENPKTAAAKLTPDTLIGTWRGTVNGEKLMLSFHRPPVEKDVQLDIYFGEATIGALAGFTIAEDGSSAEVVQHSAGGGMKFGTLIPGEPGKLKLELYGRQKGQQETMLTREAEAAATGPRQAEARELLGMWKTAAYGSETIPGMFLWTLVTEAQACAGANPNLDSSARLLELFDSRITERDWTQSQVIPLLNAATDCSDELLKACLASEKLAQRWLGTWDGKIGERACSLWIVRRGPAVTGITMMMLYPEEASVDDLVYYANSNRVTLDLSLYNEHGKTSPLGRLEPVSDTQLRFNPAGAKPGGGGVILTRKIEVLPTEPREQSARELFTLWKSTANDDGSIPGRFIGQLATEVRVFGKAHAGRVHADNIVKLLPRFVTSRDWTPAEVISLLDDVAHYSTEPIEALRKKTAAATPPAGKTAEQIVESVRPNLPGLPPLKGTLRTGERDTPFTFEMTGTALRLRFENPARELALTPGPESAELKDTAGPVRPGDRILDSEVTLGDLSMRCLYWPEKKLIGQETIKTLRCDVVDCVNPDTQDDCMMVRLFVSRSGWLMPSGTILRMNCFNRDGKLARSISITSAMKIPDVRGETATVVKSVDVVHYQPGTNKTVSKTTVTFEKPKPAEAPDSVPSPAAASPAVKSSVKWLQVDLEPDGTLSLDRKPVSLETLTTQAAQHPEWRLVLDADERIPYARVAAVADTLRTAGVSFGYLDGRMGDGKLRVANLQANYQFDDRHRFSMCRPGSYPHFFTVGWRGKDGKPAQHLRFYPDMTEETRGRWAVAWEPGTDLLWWVDASHFGRMQIADPARVAVDRVASPAAASKELGMPDSVLTEFRRLGLMPAGGSGDAVSREVLTAVPNGQTSPAAPAVRTAGDWTDDWQALAKSVAASRGLPAVDPEAAVAWGPERDGLQSGLLMAGQAKPGETLTTRLVIRNVSTETKTLHLSPVPNRIDVAARSAGVSLKVHKVVLFGTDPLLPFTFKPGEQLEFPGVPVRFGVERDPSGKVKVPEWPVCGVESGTGTVKLMFSLASVGAPDCGEVSVEVIP